MVASKTESTEARNRLADSVITSPRRERGFAADWRTGKRQRRSGPAEQRQRRPTFRCVTWSWICSGVASIDPRNNTTSIATNRAALGQQLRAAHPTVVIAVDIPRRPTSHRDPALAKFPSPEIYYQASQFSRMAGASLTPPPSPCPACVYHKTYGGAGQVMIVRQLSGASLAAPAKPVPMRGAEQGACKAANMTRNRPRPRSWFLATNYRHTRRDPPAVAPPAAPLLTVRKLNGLARLAMTRLCNRGVHGTRTGYCTYPAPPASGAG